MERKTIGAAVLAAVCLTACATRPPMPETGLRFSAMVGGGGTELEAEDVGNIRGETLDGWNVTGRVDAAVATNNRTDPVFGEIGLRLGGTYIDTEDDIAPFIDETVTGGEIYVGPLVRLLAGKGATKGYVEGFMGVAFMRAKAELDNGLATISDTDSDVAFRYGGGAGIVFANGFTVGAEYAMRTFDFNGVDIDAGTWSVLAGVSF